MKENKKISSENMDEKGYIKSILQNEFSLAEDIAENISLRLAQGLIKKLRLKSLKRTDCLSNLNAIFQPWKWKKGKTK